MTSMAQRGTEGEKLLNWAFRQFAEKTVAAKGTVVATAPGGGCVDVHSAPGHASSVLSCVSSSSATTYEVEQGPVYVAETDSTTHLPMGTIWWYLTGPDGWVAQDFLAGANG